MNNIFSSEYIRLLKLILELLASVFVVILFCLVMAGLVMYLVDRFQTHETIRRNYPLIGRFRYFFEYLGEFFRQYFFAGDREELPFNRAQRTWVYRAAKNVSNTSSFGSTKDLRAPGTALFLNCPWPTLDRDGVASEALRIGPYCRQPYHPLSFFNISGMSYGALSAPAVRALSYGAAKAGCWMNTGEGGLSPYHLEGGCDLVCQIGTAKYGYRDAKGQLSDEKLIEAAAHKQVRMFEIKLSQGAKPGKGGMLPGDKVTEEIAAIRGIAVGEDSISPNRHLDIESNQDLLKMIARIRDVTGKPVGIKFVLGSWEWLEELFELIQEQGEAAAPDFITLDGCNGGTGAAPMPLMDDVGLRLEESLPLVVALLEKYNLRDRVRVIASAKLINPNRVAWALALGADFCVSARGFLFSLGCIQAMQCSKNTCPTGITTTNPRLQRGLVPADKAMRVAYYHKNLVHEVGLIAHSCGVAEPRQLESKHVRVVQTEGYSVPLEQLSKDIEVMIRK